MSVIFFKPKNVFFSFFLLLFCFTSLDVRAGIFFRRIVIDQYEITRPSRLELGQDGFLRQIGLPYEGRAEIHYNNLTLSRIEIMLEGKLSHNVVRLRIPLVMRRCEVTSEGTREMTSCSSAQVVLTSNRYGRTATQKFSAKITLVKNHEREIAVLALTNLSDLDGAGLDSGELPTLFELKKLLQ